MFPPNKIFIPSDKNEMALHRILSKDKNRKEAFYEYRYTKTRFNHKRERVKEIFAK